MRIAAVCLARYIAAQRLFFQPRMSGGVSFGLGIQTNGKIRVIADPVEHRQRILKDAFPPVMSYFEPQKRTSTGRSFIESQRSRWCSIVSMAEQIVIVEIRAREHDSHIWDPFENTNAHIIYCSGRAAGDKFRCWSGNHRRTEKDNVLQGYFLDEFDSLCKKIGV